jgi:hypothetical protein
MQGPIKTVLQRLSAAIFKQDWQNSRYPVWRQSVLTDGFELNELGATGPDEFEQADGQELDTKEAKDHLRLGEMILKLQDGELEERYFLRMQKWLMCDEKALRYYLEFMGVCAGLYHNFNKTREPLKLLEISK